ncbi:hypothetical protein, partial [Acinetobacter baumannii]
VLSIISGIFLTIRLSWPEPVLQLKELVRKKLTLEEVNSIYPIPFLLGVVGTTKSGKTTFLNQALRASTQTNRTNIIYGEVLSVPRKYDNYFIVIDGDGAKLKQQFEIINKVDYLLVFLDHNMSHTKKQLNTHRLREHENFFEHLKGYLSEHKKIKKIHLVLNKQDLWDSSAKKKQLCDWLETKVQDCIDSLNIEVSYSFHSNLNSASVNELINNISQEVVSANDRKK